jgi:hypothetical protein
MTFIASAMWIMPPPPPPPHDADQGRLSGLFSFSLFLIPYGCSLCLLWNGHTKPINVYSWLRSDFSRLPLSFFFLLISSKCFLCIHIVQYCMSLGTLCFLLGCSSILALPSTRKHIIRMNLETTSKVVFTCTYWTSCYFKVLVQRGLCFGISL